MAGVIKVLSTGVPSELHELGTLGNTIKRRQKDILAFFDVGVSNGPVEAAGGRLEHLRGIVLGFRNLDHFRLEVFAALGTAPGEAQRTLKCEEPLNVAHSISSIKAVHLGPVTVMHSTLRHAAATKAAPKGLGGK